MWCEEKRLVVRSRCMRLSDRGEVAAAVDRKRENRVGRILAHLDEGWDAFVVRLAGEKRACWRWSCMRVGRSRR